MLCSNHDRSDHGKYEEAESPALSVIPINASLHFVNRQIWIETAIIYYRRSAFVLDMNGTQTMEYLQGLPDVARNNITSIALTSELLYDKHVPSVQAWSGDKDRSLHRKDGLTLITPFATLLVEALPRLSEVFFHVPVGGSAPLYCAWATRELHMLLKHGRIQRLVHVFDGANNDSQECYQRLMGPLADGRQLAEHEFELGSPLVCGVYGDPTQTRRAKEWISAREGFVKEHARPFAWEWVDRGVDICSGHSAQTVIACHSPAL